MVAETDELSALWERYVPRAYRIHHPIIAATGEGAFLVDTAGNRYIDFAGGIGATNVGQRHPKVVAAIERQLQQILHTGPVVIHENYIRLCAKLSNSAPGGVPKQVHLANSGAEAIENAVRLARYATGRPAIISFGRGFHGRSLLAASLTGKANPYKTAPASCACGVFHATFPDPYRPPVGVEPGLLVDHCLGVLDEIALTQVPKEQVAAIIVEPIQGEGGYIVPPPGFLGALQQWCETAGALLIVDEIQSGFGRTGRLFASEHEELTPDILVVGKSMAGGLPLAGIVASRELFDQVPIGGIGGTFTGNPLGCAAALAVLAILDDRALETAVTVGESARQRLVHMSSGIPFIGEVRGLGPMLAIEIVHDRDSRLPAPQLAESLVVEAREGGLLLIRAGLHNNVVRVLPPLLIDEETLEAGLKCLEEAIAVVKATV